MTSANCEDCINYAYDEEYEEYVCCVDLDMDEFERIRRQGVSGCPFFRPGDEYSIVKKQN